jgi:hypothetical protein
VTVAVALLAFAVPAAHAQPVPEAEATLRAYTDALRAADWVAAARHIEPEGLARVAELVDVLALLDESEQAGKLFPPKPGQDPVMAFDRFMRMVARQAPEMEDALRGMRMEIIGSVREGEDLVHIVGRTNTAVGAITVEGVEVTTLRRTGDRWVVKLSAEIDGVIRGLESMRAAVGDADGAGE